MGINDYFYHFVRIIYHMQMQLSKMVVLILFETKVGTHRDALLSFSLKIYSVRMKNDMDKYEVLKSKLESHIKSVEDSIADMQADLYDEKVAKDITDARRLLELTIENVETRVTVMEMMSVVDELKTILKEVE